MKLLVDDHENGPIGIEKLLSMQTDIEQVLEAQKWARRRSWR